MKSLKYVLLLVLSGMLTFGNYYSYDLPASLSTQLQAYLNTTYQDYQLKLGLLYSIYSFPNVIIPLLGGIVLDKFGFKRILIISSFLVLLGQTLFGVGIDQKQFPLMLIGRFIFGVGAEVLGVSQVNLSAIWFHGRGLAFANGVHSSIMKIASAGSLNLSLFFIRDYSLSFAVHVGTACCALSFVMALISARIKRNVLKRDRSKIYVEEIEASSSTLNEQQCQHKGKVVPLNDTVSSKKTPVDDQVNVKDLCTLNQTYWILFSISVTLYGSIFPFLNISQELFQSKWFPNNPEYAALAMSIPDIVAVFAVPLFGLLLDNYGHQSEMMPAAAAFVAVSHILTGFTDTSPFITMTIIGFGYSLFASSLWSSVPLLVGTHQIGTAYGILFCGLNLSLSLFPIAISLIQGKVSQGDYFLIQIFFIVLSGISFLFGVGLCTTMTYKNQLNNSLSKQQSNFDFTVEN